MTESQPIGMRAAERRALWLDLLVDAKRQENPARRTGDRKKPAAPP